MLENKTNKNPSALVQEESLFTLKHQKLLNTGREGVCMCGCGLTCFHFAPQKKKKKTYTYAHIHTCIHTYVKLFQQQTERDGGRLPECFCRLGKLRKSRWEKCLRLKNVLFSKLSTNEYVWCTLDECWWWYVYVKVL